MDVVVVVVVIEEAEVNDEDLDNDPDLDEGALPSLSLPSVLVRERERDERRVDMIQ